MMFVPERTEEKQVSQRQRKRQSVTPPNLTTQTYARRHQYNHSTHSQGRIIEYSDPEGCRLLLSVSGYFHWLEGLEI